MPDKVKNTLVLTVISSIVIHLLLFTLLYLSKQAKQIEPEKAKPIPIKAQLIFIASPEMAEEEPPVSPSPVEPELLSETINENFVTEEPTIDNLPEIKVAPPDTVAQEKERQAPLNVPATEMDAPKPQIAKSDLPPIMKEQATFSQDFNQPMQDVVQGQLHNYQISKLDAMAEQAAAEYRKQLTSPTLFSKKDESSLTEEEKFAQKITTNIDCSSTTNQTMAVVMRIMGGSVKCSEPPPFDSFIQKRLNKTAELPAMQQ